MKALECRKLGNPLKDEDVLFLKHNHESRKIADEEVRVRVAAVSLNFADVLQVQGLYQEKPKLPFIPGGEVSGRVVEVGSRAKNVQVGDMVCAMTLGGALAEEVLVRDSQILKLQGIKDLESAAGLPVAFGTAHLAICERANLQAGQTILILGAAGGVGVAAVQIAKLKGAKVIAVARGSEKVEHLRSLKADHVIDTSDEQRPLREVIKAAAPKGVDVVFDTVGGKQFEDALKNVKWGAQILVIGFASGTIPKLAANVALVKNLTIHGIYWGSYLLKNPEPMLRGLKEVSSWLAAGKINVPSSHRYSFEEAKEGFRALMERKAIGKVLLIPNATPSRL